MRILGIDEAGRGCVIGPMVIGGVIISKNKLPQLDQLGVKDSKQLSSSRRQNLVDSIKETANQTQLIIIPPSQIDQISLNELDLRAINRLINKFQPQKALFDVPTHPNGVERFVQAVRYGLDFEVDLVGENKADLKYPLVSAASILAKVKRDQIIEELKEKYGDFGSGYMSDPKTQQFLVDYHRQHKSFPKIVRTKWTSVKRLLFQQQNL